MKTPEYKGPAQLSSGDYADKLKALGTPPSGYRFLNLDDTSKETDLYLKDGCGPWTSNSRFAGETIEDSHWPVIRKIQEVKRGPKGRFVSTKPAPTPKSKKEKPLITIFAEGTGPSRKYRVEHGGAQLEEGDKELLKGIDTFRTVRQELADLKAWKSKVLAAI